MTSSLFRRILPWMFLAAMLVAGVAFYYKAPRGDIEISLPNPSAGSGPALPSFQKLTHLAREKRPRVIKVAFTVGEEKWVERFFVPRSMSTLTVLPRGERVIVNGNELSLEGFAERMGRYDAESDPVPPSALHFPPECTLREWADFLRAGSSSGVSVWMIAP